MRKPTDGSWDLNLALAAAAGAVIAAALCAVAGVVMAIWKALGGAG